MVEWQINLKPDAGRKPKPTQIEAAVNAITVPIKTQNDEEDNHGKICVIQRHKIEIAKTNEHTVSFKTEISKEGAGGRIPQCVWALHFMVHWALGPGGGKCDWFQSLEWDVKRPSGRSKAYTAKHNVFERSFPGEFSRGVCN